MRDCYDQTVQLMDLVESYRDVLSGLMEINLSSVSIGTNEIMRVLTVISSVFIPLTFYRRCLLRAATKAEAPKQVIPRHNKNSSTSFKTQP